MEIKIHVQHLHLSDPQEEVIRAKFEKLTHLARRLTDESSEIRVDLSHEASKRIEDSYVCKLTIFAPQDTLRAEAKAATLESAVDEVIEKIKKPIEHYKDKVQHISDRH